MNVNRVGHSLQVMLRVFVPSYVFLGVALSSASGLGADLGSKKPDPQPAETSSGSVMDKTPMGKGALQATEKAVEKSVEKAVEKATEGAAAKAAEKAEQKAKRPAEWMGPTKVGFMIFVLDIDAIDDANQNFTANVFIHLRWRDYRLATEEGGPPRQMPLDTVWNPQMVFTNLTGIVSRSLPNVVKVEPDGTVSYRQHYTAKFSQPLRLSDFPKDKHTFLIQAAAAEYGWDQLEFVPETAPWDPSIKGGAMADELSLPDWNILGYEAVSMPYRPIKAVNQAGFGIRFEAQRYFVYYLWQIVLPMSVVVVMSWAAFWVGRQEVSVRIGIATSSILTMVAYRFVLASLLPKLPYMTRMDYLTVGSTVLVFLALFMVVVITSFGLYRKELWAEKLNVWSRVGFPAAYLFLLGAFILT